MISERLGEVRRRIVNAAVNAGRDPGEVRLLAVTKTHPVETVREAIDAGLTVLGENRVQEAAAKYQGIEGVELHLIGHLQSNKAKLVPGLFAWVESIDALSTAEALSRRCEAAGRSCSVLLQYNSSREASKSGYTDASKLLEDADRVAALPGLALRGVMTIGPFVEDAVRIAAAFSATRALYEKLRAQRQDDRVDTLSMGMTDDFEIAIAEGSTEVRIGSAIFGARA